MVRGKGWVWGVLDSRFRHRGKLLVAEVDD